MVWQWEPCGVVCFTFAQGLIWFAEWACCSKIFSLLTPFWRWSNVVAYTLFAIMASISQVQTAVCSPGYVSKIEGGLDNYSFAKLVKAVRGMRRCAKCNGPKPPRAHHCYVCNRCVIKMDHHCPWVNNCVGIANQKLFLLFLLYVCIMCVYTLSSVTFSILSCRGFITPDIDHRALTPGKVQHDQLLDSYPRLSRHLAESAGVERKRVSLGSAALLASSRDLGNKNRIVERPSHHGLAVDRPLEAEDVFGDIEEDPMCELVTAPASVVAAIVVSLEAVVFGLFTSVMLADQLYNIFFDTPGIDHLQEMRMREVRHRGASSSMSSQYSRSAPELPSQPLASSKASKVDLFREVFGSSPSLSWLLPSVPENFIIQRDQEFSLDFTLIDSAKKLEQALGQYGVELVGVADIEAGEVASITHSSSRSSNSFDLNDWDEEASQLDCGPFGKKNILGVEFVYNNAVVPRRIRSTYGRLIAGGYFHGDANTKAPSTTTAEPWRQQQRQPHSYHTSLSNEEMTEEGGRDKSTVVRSSHTGNVVEMRSRLNHNS
eukprot:Lankesteria_metandrocarpae@DN4374_c0_g1_i1.p1